MISKERLESQYYPVVDLGEGLVRCTDELPGKAFHTYFDLSPTDGVVRFTVSENHIDDDFARLLLAEGSSDGAAKLVKRPFAENAYGFTHLLLVPHTHHSELGGRFDAERPHSVLCIPVYDSEFSGSEGPTEFFELRRRVVATRDWKRKPEQTCQLRFDNPKTSSGTGDRYVVCSVDLVLRELDNLAGSPDGFLEIINHRGAVIEVLFSEGDTFTLITDRNDARAIHLNASAVRDRIHAFLAS